MGLAVFIMVIVLVAILTFVLIGPIINRKSTDVMLLGIIFIMIGAIVLFEPYLPENIFRISFQYALIIFGLLVGLVGFLKD